MKIARSLLIVALGIGAPQLYVQAAESTTLQPGSCVDLQAACARIHQPDARVSTVFTRGAARFSLRPAKRAALWQAAFVSVGAVPTSAQHSLLGGGTGVFLPLSVRCGSTPVRAPPASA
jgi:hypothetical protein